MNDHKNGFSQAADRSACGRTWIFFRVISGGTALLYFLSGIYWVSQNEIAVHQRFGRIIEEAVQPGVHYRLPWPVDTVQKVAVTPVRRLVVDSFRGVVNNTQNPDGIKDATGLDSYCITGDNKLAVVNCVIRYRVANPRQYLFCVKDPDIMLKALACKTILHCMASMTMDEILAKSNQSVAADIRKTLQKSLEHLETGISIASVEIDNIRPPDRVAGIVQM